MLSMSERFLMSPAHRNDCPPTSNKPTPHKKLDRLNPENFRKLFNYTGAEQEIAPITGRNLRRDCVNRDVSGVLKLREHLTPPSQARARQIPVWKL